MISLRVLPPIPLYPPLFFSVKYLYSSGRERSAKREFFDGNADNCRIHGHTTSSRFSLFSRFSMDSMSRTRCLFPLPFDRAGMNIGNRGTDAGSMLFRCTRFFLVEWKCFTIFFFLLLFISLFFLSFSLFRSSVGRRVGTKHRREHELEGEEKGMRKIWLGCYVDPISPFIFLSTSRGGNRGPCRTSAVANEIRRNRNASTTVARSSVQVQPTLSSFTCHFWQETRSRLESIYDSERKTKEECEREKEKEEGLRKKTERRRWQVPD